MKSVVVATALIALASTASAQIVVSEAWVRGTVAGQTATGAFLRVTSPVATTLVGASSPAAGIVEIHSTTMESGVMKMRPAPRVPLVANEPLDLRPGGYHIMLMGLKEPLAAGAMVPITLTFEDAAGKRTQAEAKATVRPLAAAPPKHAH